MKPMAVDHCQKHSEVFFFTSERHVSSERSRILLGAIDSFASREMARMNEGKPISASKRSSDMEVLSMV